ncbi:MAG: GspH/FimT family pseudopilin [Lysobacter sp.]
MQRAHTRSGQSSQVFGRWMHGFTLIELMVTVAVLAVVLAIAFPSFRGLINANRLAAASNEWLATLQIARMEAVRRNQRVVICPSTNGTSCAGTSWQRVITFVDTNRDGAAAGPTETVLRETTVDAPVVISVSQAISGATPAHRITMRSNGLAHPGNASTVLTAKMGVCLVASQPAQNARRISLSGSRVSVDDPETSTPCAVPGN